MLVTELAWRRVPKDLDEQLLRQQPRGSQAEEYPHRVRYKEVGMSGGGMCLRGMRLKARGATRDVWT